MKRIAVLFAALIAGSAQAQCPTIGSLCDGVASTPSSADFWEKWNAADYVIYGTPRFLDENSPCRESGPAFGQWGGNTPPAPARCEFLVTPIDIWKGPSAVQVIFVRTWWGHQLANSDPVIPEYSYWQNEPCAAEIGGGPQVYFLRNIAGMWQTYRCFGTNTYDLSWLLAEVGAPLPVEAQSWGHLKATYR